MSSAFPARNLVAMVASAGLLVSGCGSSNQTAKESPSPTPTKQQAITKAPDPCTLVTAADAGTATGKTMTSASGTTQIPGACFYTSSDGAIVYVLAQAYSDASTASSVSPEQMAAAMSGYGIANAKVVTGIGDKAVEYNATAQSGGSGIAIFVFKANVVLVIVMSPSNSSTAIETMARTAVGRL
jgi:hypothetical protein